jgi:hypothetical protein
MPHKRSLEGTEKQQQRLNGYYELESREFRNARFFCFRNSKRDVKTQESVFVGNPEDLKIFVEATVPGALTEDIPDCPEGLVLTNNHGEGYFDFALP